MANGIRVINESDASAAGAIRTETTSSRVWTLPDASGEVGTAINKYIRGATHDRYMIPALVSGASPGTAAAVVNVARVNPMFVENTITIDRIACEITTGSSGNVRLGIWADDGNGYPGTLLVDSGQIAISGTGVKTATISLTLTPGLYWIGYVTDTANTFRALTTATGVHVLPWGVSSSAWNLTALLMWSVAHTYGALTNYPGGGAIVNVTIPLVGFRVA